MSLQDFVKAIFEINNDQKVFWLEIAKTKLLEARSCLVTCSMNTCHTKLSLVY